MKAKRIRFIYFLTLPRARRHCLAAILIGVAGFDSPLALLRAQGSSINSFTYQGRLEDRDGPANGLFDFSFALFTASRGGEQIGEVALRKDIPVSNGLFTVSVEFRDANSFSGADRWLEIAIRPLDQDPVTLSPRRQITAAPYAIRAANATAAVTVTGVVPAGQISGTLPLARLPAAVVTNGANGVNISGTFAGNGAGMTNVNLDLNSRGAFALSGNFVLTSSPGVGEGPVSVTAADVNGDGRPDLISANRGSFGGGNTLTVLTNNGSGGFGLASTPVVGSEPFAVTAADVNGDGKPDLISANSTANTLTVLTNNGSGGFVLAVSPGVGNRPISITAADVNGDGRPDLISANGGANTLTVLTNNGSGGFGLASSPVVGSFPNSVTAADVNGDGKPDLICANSSADTLTVLLNNGTGGFGLNSSPGVGSRPFAVISADVNGDGKADLISANVGIVGGNTLSVLMNTAVFKGAFNGTFSGNGAGLTNLSAAQIPGLDASKIISGTLADALLSANVALRDGGNAFTGYQTITGGNVGIGTTGPQTALHVYSANSPTTIRVQSSGGFGAGRIEFLSDPQGSASEWRPGYIQSTDNGGFAGGLSFVVNGSGFANRFAELEVMRIVNGRVGIGTATPVSALQVVGTVTATAFNPPSDRHLKENFAPVSPREVLEKVAALPISRWNFKGDSATPHVGPMAQDFHAAFGLGTDERHIATVDADGVALAAIQGLNAKVEGRMKNEEAFRRGWEEKLQQKATEITELKARLDRLEQLLNRSAR